MKEELQTTHILSIVSTFYQIYILNRLNNYNNWNWYSLPQSTELNPG